MSKEITFDQVVKRFLGLLGLLILSPLVLSFGFKALRVYGETSKVFIAYILLFLGVILILTTVFLGFKAVQLFLKFLFKK